MMRRRSQRGSALLAVFMVSRGSVRDRVCGGKYGAVRNRADGNWFRRARTYYLATGSVERALLYMFWGPQFRNPDGSPKYYEPGMSRLNFNFPSGVATVEIIPESSKININTAMHGGYRLPARSPGRPPERASEITAAIVDWPNPTGSRTYRVRRFYGYPSPSFRARHASLEEIEELLLVKGMTP